jgi:hypothetical protein
MRQNGELDKPYTIKATVVDGEVRFDMVERPVEPKPEAAKGAPAGGDKKK